MNATFDMIDRSVPTFRFVFYPPVLDSLFAIRHLSVGKRIYNWLYKKVVALNQMLKAGNGAVKELTYDEVLKVQKKFSSFNFLVLVNRYHTKAKQWHIPDDDVLGKELLCSLDLLQELNERLESAKILKAPPKPFRRSIMKAPEGLDLKSTFKREELYADREI